MTSNESGESGRSRNEEERQKNIRRATEFKSELNNPCLKEYNMSSACIMDNLLDKEKCGAYFANYRTCTEFWNRVKAERRSRGIRPHLPLPEHREAIKKEYIAKMKK